MPDEFQRFDVSELLNSRGDPLPDPAETQPFSTPIFAAASTPRLARCRKELSHMSHWSVTRFNDTRGLTMMTTFIYLEPRAEATGTAQAPRYGRIHVIDPWRIETRKRKHGLPT